jgi:predicted flavoprotein YhiN
MQAAEKFEMLARMRERRARSRKKNGELGHIALTVLRALLFRFQDFRTGQIDPSLDTIARYTGHSVTAVHAAIARLRKNGFLSWLRRYVFTGREGLRGPQVEQTSNAYQVTLPKKLNVPMAPPPDDDVQRRRMEAAETKRMLASLPLHELPGQLITDEGLAGMLARLGRAVMSAERGSI